MPAPRDGRIDARVLADRLGMPLVADDDARTLGARPRDRGHRQGTHQRGRARARAARRRRESVRACRASTVRRSCWSRGRRGEAAGLTCPGGRRCARSSIPAASRSSPSRSTSMPTRREAAHRGGPPVAPVAHRPRARRRRAVRHGQRPERCLDRRGRDDRARRGAGVAGGEPRDRVVPQPRPLDVVRPRWPRCWSRRARSGWNPSVYVAMVRDWVERGSDSPYAHPPDEVVARAADRTDDEARAAADFELGQHLHRTGDHDAARRSLARGAPTGPAELDLQAQRLDPRGRPPGPDRRPTTAAGSRTCRPIGAENYYPPIVP